MSEIHFEPEESTYEDGYTVITNNLIVDVNITDAGYRLLCYLHSNSPSWKVYGRFTCKLLGWGKEKLTSAIKNLYNLGYITRIQNREKGKWTYFTYKYSNKPKFKNEPWASQNKPSCSKPEISSNVDQNQPKQASLPVQGFQPERGKPDPVESAPENRPLPKPNKPMPNNKALKKALPSYSSSSRAMEASPAINPSSPSRKRKHKRKEDHENRFQYLMGLNICDETGVIDEDEMSFLSFTYTQKQLDNAYFHLQHKINEKQFKAKSTIAIFKYLLKNEHNARGSNVDINLAYAKTFAKDMKWHTLDFKERYVIDRNNPSKDIDFNLEPSTFRDILGSLWMSLNANYGT